MTKYASLVQHLKINNVAYLINSLKKKNHMNISINTGAFYKSQQTGIGENFLNLTNIYKKNLKDYIILNVEKLDAFPLR